MKAAEILKKRKELCNAAGKGEYFFFTSILLSSLILCAVCVFATDSFMKTPEVSEAYGDFFGGIKLGDVRHPFFKEVLSVGGRLASVTWENLPSMAVFFAVFVLIVCPIAQGTIRWGAYLAETGSKLPIGAIMFYFTSPSLYFSQIVITLRLLFRKAISALLFLLPPVFCIFLSLVLGSDYYGQKTLSAACLILSVLWLILAAVLNLIFCQRYAAVRYLYALGNGKKVFRRSVAVTKERRGWFVLFNLRLLPNLLLALPIFTAPLALSRIITGHCLAVKEAIAEKRKCQAQ
ncbi:MAG: hypothetical protein IIW33_03460 [Oscillospiraceae bacterium]|nr:hypothetical protein [Oscillospiraceae bacterium]